MAANNTGLICRRRTRATRCVTANMMRRKVVDWW